MTRPFKLEGDTLEVNADAHTGHMKVEVLDENGSALPQFSGKSAKIYRGHNNLRLKPQWKSATNLKSLKGQTIRLRFTLHNTKLYAFQIQ